VHKEIIDVENQLDILKLMFPNSDFFFYAEKREELEKLKRKILKFDEGS
jgi:hypothetical protein